MIGRIGAIICGAAGVIETAIFVMDGHPAFSIAVLANTLFMVQIVSLAREVEAELPAPQTEPSLQQMLAAAAAAVARMSDEDRRAMHRAQMRSYIVSHAAIGLDRDEAEYAAALKAGDQERLAELRAAMKERARQAGEWFDREHGETK